MHGGANGRPSLRPTSPRQTVQEMLAVLLVPRCSVKEGKWEREEEGGANWEREGEGKPPLVQMQKGQNSQNSPVIKIFPDF